MIIKIGLISQLPVGPIPKELAGKIDIVLIVSVNHIMHQVVLTCIVLSRLDIFHRLDCDLKDSLQVITDDCSLICAIVTSVWNRC